MDPIKWSYNRHQEMGAEMDIPLVYTLPNSIDAWRHRRMLDTLIPVIQAYPKSEWITIGDGRYGSDSFYLLNQGLIVHATNITDVTLKVAFEKGYINSFSSENAEKLSQSDDSYDFSFCKESYHHFPRPPIAFYEMIRISRIGTILIEPIYEGFHIIDGIKNLIKKVIRGDKNLQYEEAGNYVFRVSIDEIIKMATAIQCSVIAYKKFNDFRLDQAAKRDRNRIDFWNIVTNFVIIIQNIFTTICLLNYGLASIIIFKKPISKELKAKMKNYGYTIVNLPQNPYAIINDNLH